MSKHCACAYSFGWNVCSRGLWPLSMWHGHFKKRYHAFVARLTKWATVFFSFFFLLQTRAAESANYKKQKRVGWAKCMKILKMVHIGGLHGAFKGRDETMGGGVANSYVVSTGFNLNATSWIPVVLPSKQLAYCCKPQICRHSPGNRCCCSLRSFFLLVTASLWV